MESMATAQKLTRNPPERAKRHLEDLLCIGNGAQATPGSYSCLSIMKLLNRSWFRVWT
jgi:hypothetical protein